MSTESLLGDVARLVSRGKKLQDWLPMLYLSYTGSYGT